jgi:hypothetical protein
MRSVKARLRLRSAVLALFGRRRPRIAIALVFFAAVLVTRYIDTDPGDAVLALNTFPIAIVVFDLGWEQGLVAAGAAFAAVMLWAGARPSDLTPFGYVAGGATYFGTAALLGTFADRLPASRSHISRSGPPYSKKSEGRRLAARSPWSEAASRGSCTTSFLTAWASLHSRPPALDAGWEAIPPGRRRDSAQSKEQGARLSSSSVACSRSCALRTPCKKSSRCPRIWRTCLSSPSG